MLSAPHTPVDPARTAERLLADFRARTPGAALAVLVTAEGLAVARTDGLATDDAERLAALASGLGAMTRSAAEAYGGGRVSVTTVDMGHRHLCLLPVDDRLSLLFLADEQGELSRVLYEAARTAVELTAALTSSTAGTTLGRMFLGTH